MKKYKLKVKFMFTGTVEVEASSYQEAKKSVSSNFGLVLGGNLHYTDENIIDWEFPVHPEKFITIWK